MPIQQTPRLTQRPSRHPNQIRKYRLAAGLSQRELGASIRRTRSVVSAWERGRYLPSVTNLFLFRQFYQRFDDRRPILYLPSRESTGSANPYLASRESAQDPVQQGFRPGLSWTHYRVLMRVDDVHERQFYEVEADRAGWNVETLERQIHTHLFLRLKKSRSRR